MAADMYKMDSINRFNSPMVLCLEDLTEPHLEQQRRKETTQKLVQESSASFLIGSMETVSQNVANLEQDFKCFGADDFVIESLEFYTSLSTAGQFQPEHEAKPARTQEKSAQTKEHDKTELQRFTHRHQLSATNTVLATERSATKQMKTKPKLVELYQFPGFSDHCPTPLPYETAISTIIGNVVSAHKSTGGKICSPRELRRTLSKAVTQKILLDCFWWIFLNRYKPDGECQRKMFDRVAENYVQLLRLCQDSYHGDAFLSVFPCVLSQAIYCSFCFSFPQSLHQFQSDDFKAQLCSLLWQWIGGICPILGIYNTWNYVALEPPDDMIHGKEMQKKASTNKGGKNLKGDVLRLHPSCNGSTAKELCPASCRPPVTHMLFNLQGHSPLIQYYLQKQKVEPQAGLNILVQRTEIQKQESIPYPFHFVYVWATALFSSNKYS
ncbi:protein FAM227A isoform X2 [Pseudophryne corroboree]|uniref:protein FAM227A isoform X2 n=1 Tax=Pseudophryne corroboree TaxID=495146 RepID=UPI003081374D